MPVAVGAVVPEVDSSIPEGATVAACAVILAGTIVVIGRSEFVGTVINMGIERGTSVPISMVAGGDTVAPMDADGGAAMVAPWAGIAAGMAGAKVEPGGGSAVTVTLNPIEIAEAFALPVFKMMFRPKALR